MFSNSVLYNYYNKFANCVNAKFSSCGKLLLLHVHGVFTNYMLLVNIIVDHKYKLVHPIGFQLNMLNDKLMNLYM